jgi:hypothetical protein
MDSRGETVIPYDRIVNEEAWQRGEEFRLGERVDSDHLEIALRKRRGRTEQRRKGVGDRNKTVFLGAVLSLKKKKRSKKLGRREGGWEKKIQKQGGKCRGEESVGMAQKKWMGRIKREQTRGTKIVSKIKNYTG